ncbi:MAG: hypothetical protein L6R37_004285 [Teloschistes peruensis]|nr:MAG: hypothetical protein L6R37_004285 [Teloschistes peruensis]
MSSSSSSELPPFEQQVVLAEQAYEKAIEKATNEVDARLSKLDRGEPTDYQPVDLDELPYEWDTNALRTGAQKNVTKMLSSCGMSIHHLFWVNLSSQGAKKVAYTNWADANNGLTIASENYKRKDKNRGEKRLQAPEALWQSYILIAKQQGVRTTKLQAILRYCVQNKESERVIFHAAKTSTFKEEGADGYRVHTEADDRFWAILGSHNGASTIRMLSDQHKETGHRTVEKVIVLPRKHT